MTRSITSAAVLLAVLNAGVVAASVPVAKPPDAPAKATAGLRAPDASVPPLSSPAEATFRTALLPDSGSVGLLTISRLRTEPQPARLRCWQHGVAVLDEAFTGQPNLPSGTLFSTGPASNPRLVVFGQETGLCVVTHGSGRAGGDWR